MAILDFFKKPRKQFKLRSGRKVATDVKPSKKDLKQPRPEAKEREEKVEDGEFAPTALKESKIAWRVLKDPHVTEKSTDLTALNQYTFKVLPNTAKGDVKAAVEEIYGVHVEGVRKIKVSRKSRRRPTRRGKQQGWRAGYTKAIVTLREGEKIEVLPH